MLEHRDVGFLVLLGVMGGGGMIFLLATWRDSARAIRESFKPFRVLYRPRFGVSDCLSTVLVVAVAARIATQWRWTESNWLENAFLLLALFVGVSLAACFVRIAINDHFGRRRIDRLDLPVHPQQAGDAEGVKQPGKPIRGVDEEGPEAMALRR